MHDRLSTPDILGSIMSGTQTNKAIKQEIIQEIKQTTPKKQPEEDLKEKATFNLPVNLLAELEDVCHDIRKMCRSKQISKTLLVEAALEMAFSDFQSKKQNSKLFTFIANNKAIKQ